MKRIPVIAAALVAALALVAVAASRGGPGPDATVAQTAAVTVTGTALPRGDSAGMVAPALRGTGFDGAPVAVTPGDGRGTLLVFVAHWCPHCRREVPRLVERLRQSPLPEGVDLYAISTAVDKRRPNHPPAEWLRKEGWPAPVLRDDENGTAAEAYGLSGFPYFVAVGPDGRVVARVSGELDDARFAALVEVVR